MPTHLLGTDNFGEWNMGDELPKGGPLPLDRVTNKRITAIRAYGAGTRADPMVALPGPVPSTYKNYKKSKTGCADNKVIGTFLQQGDFEDGETTQGDLGSVYSLRKEDCHTATIHPHLDQVNVNESRLPSILKLINARTENKPIRELP
jgi:hypothetical protein